MWPLFLPQVAEQFPERVSLGAILPRRGPDPLAIIVAMVILNLASPDESGRILKTNKSTQYFIMIVNNLRESSDGRNRDYRPQQRFL